MKTIEEKAKAYDEALKAAIAAHKDEDRHLKATLERIFPELQESEDERIRKGLIKALGTIGKRNWGGIDVFESIAWLEKQGEQKVPINDFKAKNWYVSEVDGKIHDMTYNPADNVESKFKVGDWVVCEVTNSVYQIKNCIENLSNHKYGYDLTNGGYIGSDEVNHYHLWTIQDAKDGDVLYSLDTNQPFIYKARNIHEQATAYCGINKYGKFFVWNTNDCIITLDKYIPATKEQRELLFRKMKEAGYVWNPTTKELSHKEVTKKSDKVWNEEDEEMKDLIDEISCHNDDVDYETHVRITRWLNELKQRLS